MPTLSILIPTYNRCEILKRTLEAYMGQTAAGEVAELLVIDDGSTDDTANAVAQASRASHFPVRYFLQDHQGPAKGRNRAIRESRGELVLMGDDDVIPSAALVAEHLAWHRRHPSIADAVLGRVEWSPEINPTPFMEWLGECVLFGYRRIGAGQVSAAHFYSCNVSLKKEFMLQDGMFDETFPYAAFEDSELGYRLARKGLRLFYNPDAVGYHFRKMSVADARRRAELVEKSYGFFTAKMLANGYTFSNYKRDQLREKFKTIIIATLPLFSPLIWLFDTHIPLPRLMYRLFYFYYLTVGHLSTRGVSWTAMAAPRQEANS